MTTSPLRKWLARLAIWLLAIAVVIQIVPYGRDHANPPVVSEPQWNSPETRALAVRACFDCHSNETRWPAYANIAPGSWLIQHDVFEGREHLNFSEWQRPQRRAAKAAAEVREREMPPIQFLPLHPEARLTDDERERLARGLAETLGTSSETGRSR